MSSDDPDLKRITSRIDLTDFVWSRTTAKTGDVWLYHKRGTTKAVAAVGRKTGERSHMVSLDLWQTIIGEFDVLDDAMAHATSEVERRNAELPA